MDEALKKVTRGLPDCPLDSDLLARFLAMVDDERDEYDHAAEAQRSTMLSLVRHGLQSCLASGDSAEKTLAAVTGAFTKLGMSVQLNQAGE